MEIEKTILNDIEDFEMEDHEEVIAFKLGASGFKNSLTEFIGKKYKLYEKYK